uniref:DNA topoisomerase n=1 Tax=Ditylenchus dipsaci TaxID=166011 RepID=A0A915D937_9BILA
MNLHPWAKPGVHILKVLSGGCQMYLNNELVLQTSVAAITASRNGATNRLVATFHSATPINNVQVVGQSEWKIHKDRVFVGAVNHLYSLSLQNLSLLEDAITGPVMDSPYCNSDLSSCIGPLGRGSIKETNNHNKILHYIAQPNRTSKPGVLLICGSTRQGVCQLRQSHHLNQQANHPNFVGFQHTSVAANSPNASTLSLVDQGGERLYVAASILPHQHLHAYRDSFPAVSTRLGPAGLLPINSGSIEGEAAVYVRQPFQVEYVAGFSHERYMYWASVQHKYVQQTQHVSNPSLTNPLVSKLIRVCEDDTTYMSYSEIELQCRSGSGDNTNFNVLKALVLLRDDLVGVFSDGDGKQSAICIFNMPKIRLTFWYNIDRCRAGTDTIGLPHIGRDSKCINKSHLPLSEDTCQLGIVDDKHALLIAGTNQGQILQMEMSGNQHNRRLDQYADYKIGSGTVEKVQFLDQKHFLVVNGNELSMLKVSMCNAPADGVSSWPVNSSATCETCIASKDPLCGWCLHEGICLRQSECQSSLLKKCPEAVGAIQPQNISINAVASHQVFVPIKNLPAPIDANKPYECFFGAFKQLLQAGKNIGAEIVSVCRQANPIIDVYRAKFSEITPRSVNNAMQNLVRMDDRVVNAVDCRTELDLRIGAAFTPPKHFANILDGVISYGSCQFPTLGFVVERYKAIKSFVSEQFWKLVGKDLNNKFDFTWERVRLFDMDATRAIHELCKEAKQAKVVLVDKHPKSKWRPQRWTLLKLLPVQPLRRCKPNHQVMKN